MHADHAPAWKCHRSPGDRRCERLLRSRIEHAEGMRTVDDVAVGIEDEDVGRAESGYEEPIALGDDVPQIALEPERADDRLARARAEGHELATDAGDVE